MKKGSLSYQSGGDKPDPEVTPKIGISLLQRQIDEAKSLVSKRPINPQAYYAWRDATQAYLDKAFGKGQKHLEMNPGSFSVMTTQEERERRTEQRHFENLNNNIVRLEGFIKQLETEIEISSIKEVPVDIIEARDVSPRIFIVHGRNDDVKTRVARFLEKAGLKVLILHEQAGRSRTIVEKLEDHSLVGHAVILLTADDVGKGITETDLRPRARQNVILELGYFCALLGRNHITVLYEDGVEIPTDFVGVEYLPLNSAWQPKLLTELNDAGFEVDFKSALRTV